MRRIEARVESWPLKQSFRISRGARSETKSIVVELREGKSVGLGECVPYPHYGESIESVLGQIRSVSRQIEKGTCRGALQGMLSAGAARNAIDCALWDLEAKLTDTRVWNLAGISIPPRVLSAMTIGLDTPDKMGDRAKELSHCPLLKLKVTGEGDLKRVEAVRRGAPRSRLIVDANEAWHRNMLDYLLQPLANLGVELIEQPLPADDDKVLFNTESCISFCADESCHTREDLSNLRGKYSVVNIKLDKTGGLTEALALISDARKFGFKIMVGCMVGSSLSIAPALILTEHADYIDLDGPLLLARDHVPSLRYDGMEISAPEPTLWG